MHKEARMDEVFAFLASTTGRVVRIVAGLVLIVIGLAWVEGAAGWLLVIIGLVPLSAGLFDWCIIARLFGRPFRGDRLRHT
jgi:type IV secretory pathway VirB2 component (pilin)